MATWQDAQGRRYLAMSMLGPVGKSAPPFKYTNGTAVDGSIMAFEVPHGRGDGQTDARSAVDLARAPCPRCSCRRERSGLHVSIREGFHRDARGRAPRAAGRCGPRGLRAGRAAAGRAQGAGLRSRTAEPASLGTNAILYAFDAETGKQLFSSELDSFNHFTNPVVAGGTVYAVTWDGKLYAFGLKK